MRIYNSKISLENIFHSIEYDIVWKFPAQFLADVIYNIVFTFLKVQFIAYIFYNSLLMATFPLCQLSYSCIYYCHGTGYNSGMNTRKCVYLYVCLSMCWYHWPSCLCDILLKWRKVMMTWLLFYKSHPICFSLRGIMMEK